MSVKPIPEGFTTLCPYLCVADADALIAFIEGAFDAQPVDVHRNPAGKVTHGSYRIGDSIVMMSEYEPKPAMLHMYVPDVDAVFAKALAAGGTEIQPVQNQFYGDRSGGVTDPCGNQWWISTHVEDVDPEELTRRARAAGR